MKSPALAACLSFLCGGLGQLYCGYVGRGLAILLGPILFVLLWIFAAFTPGLLLALYAALLVFYVWQVFDAYQCAERANRALTRPTRARRRAIRPGRRRRARRIRAP